MWTPDEALRRRWHELAELPDHQHEKRELLVRRKQIEEEKWRVAATLFEADFDEYRRITGIIKEDLEDIDERLKKIESLDVWHLQARGSLGPDAIFDTTEARDEDTIPDHHPQRDKVVAMLRDLRLGEFSTWISGHEDAPQYEGHGRMIGMVRYKDQNRFQEIHERSPNTQRRPGPYWGWGGEIVIGSAIFTERNILFPIQFENGPQWLLKIPIAAANERDWVGEPCEQFEAEVLTMKILEEETNMPVPHIFQWSAEHTSDFTSPTAPHGVRFPYILMNWFEGRTVHDLWFDSTVTKEVQEQRRTKCLEDIASAMLELNKFSYDLGGRILFDEHSKPSIIGSYEQENLQADNHATVVIRQPYRDPRAWLDDSWNLGPSDVQAPQYRSQRSTTELIAKFLSTHQQQPPENGWDLYSPRAIPKLFSYRLGQAPWELSDPPEKPFVLAHPNFTSNHFIVSEDGSLLGVIGWEGIMSVPRYVGNEQYPLWLTRDWDLAWYNWGGNTRMRPMNTMEDSPETLKYYRSVYARSVKLAHALKDDQTHIPPWERLFEVQSSTLTTRSLLYTSLGLAVRNPRLRPAIAKRIFREFAPMLIQWTETQIAEWNSIRAEPHWSTLTDNEKVAHLNKEGSWDWPVPGAPHTDLREVAKIVAFDATAFFEAAIKYEDFVSPAELEPWRAFSTLLLFSARL